MPRPYRPPLRAGEPRDLAGELLIVDAGDRVPASGLLRLGELDLVRDRLHAAIVTLRARPGIPRRGRRDPKTKPEQGELALGHPRGGFHAHRVFRNRYLLDSL